MYYQEILLKKCLLTLEQSEFDTISQSSEQDSSKLKMIDIIQFCLHSYNILLKLQDQLSILCPNSSTQVSGFSSDKSINELDLRQEACLDQQHGKSSNIANSKINNILPPSTPQIQLTLLNGHNASDNSINNNNNDKKCNNNDNSGNCNANQLSHMKVKQSDIQISQKKKAPLNLDKSKSKSKTEYKQEINENDSYNMNERQVIEQISQVKQISYVNSSKQKENNPFMNKKYSLDFSTSLQNRNDSTNVSISDIQNTSYSYQCPRSVQSANVSQLSSKMPSPRNSHKRNLSRTIQSQIEESLKNQRNSLNQTQIQVNTQSTNDKYNGTYLPAMIQTEPNEEIISVNQENQRRNLKNNLNKLVLLNNIQTEQQKSTLQTDQSRPTPSLKVPCPTPQQEKMIIKNIMNKELGTDQHNGLHNSSTGYYNEPKFIINADWWRQWVGYVNFNSNAYDCYQSIVVGEQQPQIFKQRPCKIKNKPLLKQDGIYNIRSSKNIELRENLMEHYEYEAVSQTIYQYLKLWYDIDYEIVRFLRYDPAQEIDKCLYLDLYPEKVLKQSLPVGFKKNLRRPVKNSKYYKSLHNTSQSVESNKNFKQNQNSAYYFKTDQDEIALEISDDKIQVDDTSFASSYCQILKLGKIFKK